MMSMRPRCQGSSAGAGREASVRPNEALQRTHNSWVQLTLCASWRHTASAGSGPVGAVTGR